MLTIKPKGRGICSRLLIIKIADRVRLKRSSLQFEYAKFCSASADGKAEEAANHKQQMLLLHAEIVGMLRGLEVVAKECAVDYKYNAWSPVISP